MVFSKLEGWAFDDSELFCVESVSSLGLGNITPKTLGGRIFLFFYGTIGLAAIISSVALARDLILDKISSFLRNRVEERRKKGKGTLDNFETKLSTEINVAMVFVVLMVWFLGAVVFSSLEGWSYFESVYFCYTTLTTIGYGDVVPSTSGGKFFLRWYIYIGLGTFAFVLSLVSSLSAKGFDKLIKRADAK